METVTGATAIATNGIATGVTVIATMGIATGATATAPIIALAIAPSLPVTGKSGDAEKRLRGVNVRTTGGGAKTNATTGGASANSRFKTSVDRTTGDFINDIWSDCV